MLLATSLVASALFGEDAAGVDDDANPVTHAPESFRRAALQLNLLDSQQVSVMTAFDEMLDQKLLIDQDFRELDALFRALQPDDACYESKLQQLGFSRGARMLQSTLVAGQLRSRVFAILTPSQRICLADLKQAWLQHVGDSDEVAR